MREFIELFTICDFLGGIEIVKQLKIKGEFWLSEFSGVEEFFKH
jgi:hypothetical protein